MAASRRRYLDQAARRRPMRRQDHVEVLVALAEQRLVGAVGDQREDADPVAGLVGRGRLARVEPRQGAEVFQAERGASL